MENRGVPAKMQTSPAGILKKTKGFTLLELILVILFMGLLLTFASVNWLSQTRSEKDTFLDKFSIEIALLREDSISNFQSLAIEFDVTANVVNIGALDLLRGFVTTKEFRIPEKYLLRDVVINGEKTSTGKAIMRFYPSGLVDRAILHLEEEKSGFYSLIVHPLTGKVTEENGYTEEIPFKRRGDTT
jgi:prepilin-type N-terminal cleavage/methylation domain-containing protein